MSKRPRIRSGAHAVDCPMVYAVWGGWGDWGVWLGVTPLKFFDNHAEALAFAIAESGQ